MDDQNVRDFQNSIFVFANAIGGLIQAIGMHTENQRCLKQDFPMPFDYAKFYQLMEDRGLHHNSLMTQIYNR